ncbi:hypothetical protein L228DRAFT_248330 [Xylona heveae TC161]|uniref:Mitotic checkpoint regulator, MAD2B-interacting-domain-containing protein n=1 Tax=Xylona heveae (strain CBS 132557 / TC161) TaxID=1328760 RepID=A0A165G0T3_XYLHT|nr:hypothetical protein L228DRAFT_248330 [Xylona heveae TC161]KZF21606.1 hypothetical protein L228DRAFT_248330 [Xylona heveae TC161]
MGLVEYSDSEDSGSETTPAVPASSAAPPASKSSTKSKPTFEKVVDRSNPRKIRVNLPQLSNTDSKATNGSSEAANDEPDGPPAKRARTGGGAFSGFNSFLPAPKRAGPVAGAGGSGPSASRRGIGAGVSLKTGSAPGFSRDAEPSSSSVAEPPAAAGEEKDAPTPPPASSSRPASEQKAAPAPSIPAQKSADQVEKVGNPMMFKPLSVARRPQTKKKKTTPTSTSTGSPSPAPAPTPPATSTTAATITQTTQAAHPVTASQPQSAPKPKPKVSLFSLGGAAAERDTPLGPAPGPAPAEANGGDYTPLLYESNNTHNTDPTSSSSFATATQNPYSYETSSSVSYDPQSETSSTATYNQTYQSGPPATQSLSSIADDLNLSESAKRQLFGRSGGAGGGSGGGRRGNNKFPADASAISVVNFNTDAEYAANEAIRAAGETVQHNPVRSIAPGKHSLKQLVSAASSQRDALEESFATGKRNKAEAGSKYGW